MPDDSSCTSTGILNIPNFNVYTKSVVEADARMGVYAGCTPNASNGVFQCDAYASSFDCWYNATGPSQTRHGSFVEMFEGTAGCTRDAAGCRCKPWLEQSLGLYTCPECDRHAGWHKQTPLWVELEKMAAKLNGSWYSTRSAGECVGSQQVGVDCWWREVAVQTTVNATCLADRLKSTIVANDPGCFHGCPQPTNATSDCWITCMLQSINGGNGGIGGNGGNGDNGGNGVSAVSAVNAVNAVHGEAGAGGRSRGAERRAVVTTPAPAALAGRNRTSNGGAAGGARTPLSREAIVLAFTGAFSPEAEGGCPNLPPPGGPGGPGGRPTKTLA